MDIIFVGSVYPHERENEIRRNSKDGIDNAANNFQWALLVGLDYYYPNLRVITQPAIRTYPLKYKKITFKESQFSHNPGSVDYCLGFINFPLVKHLSKYANLYKKLCKIISIEEETIIIIYGVHSPYLKAVVNLKKNNDKIRICQIVPDLPQFMSKSKNPIYRFLKSIDAILINKYLKKIDSFVLLTDYMADALKVGNRPWTRVEGIFESEQNSDNVIKENYNTILYTGNIDERYGIKTLLKTFSLIEDENYRLWIRGNGNTKQDIINATKLDSRIKYFEEMSRKKLIELQKKATVLVNPMSSQEEFIKYFFPSKTMDYLASGTPTVMNKLKCLSTEYYDYIFFSENEDAEGLKETIVNVCKKEKSELDDFGEKASQFILKNKNPIVQAKKIYEMINQL